MQITKPTKTEVMRELKTIFSSLSDWFLRYGWAAFLIPIRLRPVVPRYRSHHLCHGISHPMVFIINAVLMTFAIVKILDRNSVSRPHSPLRTDFFLWFFQMLVNGPDDAPQILDGQDFMACLIGAAMCGVGLRSIQLQRKYGRYGYYRRHHPQNTVMLPWPYDYGLRRDYHQLLLFYIQWLETGYFGFVTLFVIGIVLDYIVNGARQSVQFFIFPKIMKDCRPYHQKRP